MQETIEKLRIGSPAEMQTGPARRGDVNTMQKHHALLKSNPELMKLYDVLSNSIQNKFWIIKFAITVMGNITVTFSFEDGSEPKRIEAKKVIQF